MNLLSIEQFPNSRPDFRCRESHAPELIALVVCFALFTVAILAAIGAIPRGPVPNAALVVVAGFMGLSTALMVCSLWRTFSPFTWLCHAQGNTLWIKCSRFWYDRDSQNILILQLERSEIAWMQPAKLHTVFRLPSVTSVDGPVSGGSDSDKFYTYLDIGLSEAAIAHLHALSQEPRYAAKVRRLLAPPDYIPACPAQIVDGSTLRMCWGAPGTRVTPGIRRAVRYFSSWTDMRPPRKDRWVA